MVDGWLSWEFFCFKATLSLTSITWLYSSSGITISWRSISTCKYKCTYKTSFYYCHFYVYNFSGKTAAEEVTEWRVFQGNQLHWYCTDTNESGLDWPLCHGTRAPPSTNTEASFKKWNVLRALPPESVLCISSYGEEVKRVTTKKRSTTFLHPWICTPWKKSCGHPQLLLIAQPIKHRQMTKFTTIKKNSPKLHT